MTVYDYINLLCMMLLLQMGSIIVSGVLALVGKFNYKDVAVLGINTLILLTLFILTKALS